MIQPVCFEQYMILMKGVKFDLDRVMPSMKPLLQFPLISFSVYGHIILFPYKSARHQSFPTSL